MAGTTGRRARPAGVCHKCGNRIADGEFLRDHNGDSHFACPPARTIPLRKCESYGMDRIKAELEQRFPWLTETGDVRVSGNDVIEDLMRWHDSL